MKFFSEKFEANNLRTILKAWNHDLNLSLRLIISLGYCKRRRRIRRTLKIFNDFTLELISYFHAFTFYKSWKYYEDWDKHFSMWKWYDVISILRILLKPWVDIRCHQKAEVPNNCIFLILLNRNTKPKYVYIFPLP